MIERGGDYDIVALNDLTDTKTLAHLLKYDTVYGHFPGDVSFTETSLIVKGKEYHVYSEKDPWKLPWKEKNIDVVIESTGFFRTGTLAKPHIDAGAKRVIISAPAKSEDVETLVMGVNEDSKAKENEIVSNASCTTNCIAPVAAIMHNNFGVLKATMTTIHSYTADQRLVDGPHKDLRRARAAAQNIVPTTTGAAKATAKTIPELKGLFDGMAVRVPTVVGSLSDFTMLLSKKVSVDEVNNAFKKAITNPLYKDIVAVTEDPIVSSDIIGSTYSAIVDLSLTKVVDGDLVKVIAWYDNEWGYANRLVDMISNISGSHAG
jgi:glyceraldehyde 3-phosphate dehydrogenase